MLDSIVLSAGAVLGRNIFGWLKNSLKDGTIQSYEWKQLGKTLVTLGGFAVFTYFGINVVTEVSPEEATAIATLVDVVKSHFKK